MNAKQLVSTNSPIESGARIQARVKFYREIRRGTMRIIVILALVVAINRIATVSREAGYKEGSREGKVTGEVAGYDDGFRDGYSAGLEADRPKQGF